MVSNMAMLMLLPALVGLVLLLRSSRAAERCALILGALALLVILIDTQVWGLFRYHINGMVLNVLTTPGGLDTFELTAGSWILLAGVGALFMLLRSLLLSRARAIDPARLRLAPGLLVLLAIVVGEKLSYAWADMVNDRSVLALARVYPLYQPLTSKRLLARITGRTPSERAQMELSEGTLLRYPLASPRMSSVASQPNILVIAIDSLRGDALEPSVMPEASAWRDSGARVYEDHASGGNATRIGVFSLIYGIHGSYWPSILAERTPPVLTGALQDLGYELRVFSTTSMEFPEFRSTAWVRMNDAVEDRFPGPAKWQMDEQTGARTAEWLRQREKGRPFFAFVMLDAPHQSYDWPRDRSTFTPYSEKLEYYKLARQPDADQVTRIRNAYLNAVQHCDRVFGELVRSLRALELEDNTIVILTGDHGEEFYEHGYFGHTSNFTRMQTHVPFVVRGPHFAPGIETRPSSHIDLAPTLLELLGADAASRPNWSQGENLLNLPEQRHRVFCGWQEAAIEVPGGFLHVPLEGHKGLVEALDTAWKPHPEGDAFTRRHGLLIRDLAQDFRHFLR
jgi:membrane-anchored protein YejM (alkaline phosphatase superfamily)